VVRIHSPRPHIYFGIIELWPLNASSFSRRFALRGQICAGTRISRAFEDRPQDGGKSGGVPEGNPRSSGAHERSPALGRWLRLVGSLLGPAELCCRYADCRNSQRTALC
jgi:hypothetical protein